MVEQIKSVLKKLFGYDFDISIRDYKIWIEKEWMSIDNDGTIIIYHKFLIDEGFVTEPEVIGKFKENEIMTKIVYFVSDRLQEMKK